MALPYTVYTVYMLDESLRHHRSQYKWETRVRRSPVCHGVDEKNRRTNLNLPLRNWKCILDAYSREYFLYSLKQVWSGRRRIRTVMYPSQINVERTGWKEARRAGLATATVRLFVDGCNWKSTTTTAPPFEFQKAKCPTDGAKFKQFASSSDSDY